MRIKDPNWRQGHGTRCPSVELGKEATNAYQVWCALFNERIHGEPGVDQDDLDAALVREDMIGEMMRLVTVDAQTRALPADHMMPVGYHMSTVRAGWDIALRLAEVQTEHTDHSPLFPVEDRCRHGHRFTDRCDECEEDDL